MGNYTEDNPGRANGYYGIVTTYLRRVRPDQAVPGYLTSRSTRSNSDW